ncbi:hypothetical protein LMG7141_01948 [Ralstonia condita]|jgi:hypothetical protein|uniref:Uncharacterized protein n=1 Tax=Ralstonia condita TaxID=3058600 RepID=A0ABN9INW9_9RALS|nr:hypothetical protein [Ralstonia sp. LMG 7141]CAJ0787508.1 hypothetical protein LMG7141_01948 [Ralstonia sp. LMG 7141]
MTTLQQSRQYMKGAVFGRDFLRRTQADLKLHRHFEPKTLRWEYQIHVLDKSAEFQAGFLDAIGAYVLTTLEGVLVEPYRWNILRVLNTEGNEE